MSKESTPRPVITDKSNPILRLIVCGDCSTIAKVPHLLSCGHVLCFDCFLTLEECTKCDGVVFGAQELKFPTNTFTDAIVKCNLCKWEGKLESFDTHVTTTCSAYFTWCEDCETHISRTQGEHSGTFCPQRLVACSFAPYCSVMLKRGEHTKHNLEFEDQHLQALQQSKADIEHKISLIHNKRSVRPTGRPPLSRQVSTTLHSNTKAVDISRVVKRKRSSTQGAGRGKLKLGKVVQEHTES